VARPVEATGDDLHARLAAAQPGERPAMLVDIVRGHVARVLRIPESKIDADASFTGLGMDSLTGLELRNRLSGELSVALPATLIFQHPSIRAVTEHVLDMLLREAVALEAAVLPATSDDEEEGTL